MTNFTLSVFQDFGSEDERRINQRYVYVKVECCPSVAWYTQQNDTQGINRCFFDKPPESAFDSWLELLSGGRQAGINK